MQQGLVYIYDDAGCKGVYELESCIKRNIPNCKIVKVNAEEIKGGILKKNPPSAFFIGGGQARWYINRLGKEGRKEIIDYSNKKDSLSFFICAGAYYASSFTDFKNNKKRYNERIMLGKKRGQLALFTGMSKGRFSENKDIVSIKKIQSDDGVFNTFYFMGPDFDNLADSDKVIATFSDVKKPAVIKCGENKNIVLSSIHFEYPDEVLKTLSWSYKNINQDSLAKIIMKPLIDKINCSTIGLNCKKGGKDYDLYCLQKT
ncbi:MAG: BPL-N domain-containing protein [Alphaproteobacteria bacterium]|nr:BPL-N domain-containing protein [Alphaproteobacteria bacterium]